MKLREEVDSYDVCRLWSGQVWLSCESGLRNEDGMMIVKCWCGRRVESCVVCGVWVGYANKSEVVTRRCLYDEVKS